MDPTSLRAPSARRAAANRPAPAAPAPAVLPHLNAQRRFPDEVTQVLAHRISSGFYAPGSKLPSTRAMAQAFGVSPPIVREALSRLKHDGLVEPRQGSGVYVSSSIAPASLRLDSEAAGDAGLLADTFELRLLVEQICAELAAARRGAGDLRRMRAELQAMAQAVRSGGDGTMHDVRFHIAIARATGNGALLKLVEFLHGSLVESIRTARANSAGRPGQPQAAQREHERLFERIAAADSAGARRAIRDHLHGAARRLGLRLPPDVPARRRRKSPLPSTSVRRHGRG